MTYSIPRPPASDIANVDSIWVANKTLPEGGEWMTLPQLALALAPTQASQPVTPTPPVTTPPVTTPPVVITTGTSTAIPSRPTTSTFVPAVPATVLTQLAKEPTFSDDFSGTTLNEQWDPYYFEEGGSVVGVNTHAANVSVNNSLKLTLAAANSGACIMSKSFTFNQGYIQMIGTLPVAPSGGVANWGGLYTAVKNLTSNNNEIDVNETLNRYGSKDGSMQASPRTSLHGTSDVIVFSQTPAGSYAGTKHTYGALWVGDTVTWFYDGEEVATTTQAQAGGPNEHIIYLCEGNSEEWAGETVIGAAIEVDQIAYWPLAS